MAHFQFACCIIIIAWINKQHKPINTSTVKIGEKHYLLLSGHRCHLGCAIFGGFKYAQKCLILNPWQLPEYSLPKSIGETDDVETSQSSFISCWKHFSLNMLDMWAMHSGPMKNVAAYSPRFAQCSHLNACTCIWFWTECEAFQWILYEVLATCIWTCNLLFLYLMLLQAVLLTWTMQCHVAYSCTTKPFSCAQVSHRLCFAYCVIGYINPCTSGTRRHYAGESESCWNHLQMLVWLK